MESHGIAICLLRIKRQSDKIIEKVIRIYVNVNFMPNTGSACAIT